MSLKSRLISAFGVLVLGIVISSVLAVFTVDQVSSKFNRLTSESVPKLGDLSGLRNRGRQVHSEILNINLLGTDSESRKKSLEGLSKGINRYEEIAKEFAGRGFSSEQEKKVYGKTETLLVDVATLARAYLKNAVDADGKLNLLSLDQIKDLNEKVAAHQKALLELDDVTVETGEKWTKQANETERQAKNVILAISIALVLCGFVMSWILAKKITLELDQISNSLITSSRSVKHQSELLRESSNQLSAATLEQSAAITETVAATSEIASMIARTSDSAVQNSELVEESLNHSKEGKRALSEMISAIETIEKSNLEMSEQIQMNTSELSEISKLMNEIKLKTAAINDIVFQTKLLSFNASVEATRAGEAGKGFAVVAEEVSKLAVSSGLAAREIEKILKQSDDRVLEIISQTKSSVDTLVKKGTEKTADGQRIANRCVGLFDKLSVSVDRIAQLTNQISVAAKEQTTGIKEINIAMQRVDTSTAVNSKSAQECFHSADVTASEVQNTDEAVRKLHTIVHGNSDQAKGKLAA